MTKIKIISTSVCFAVLFACNSTAPQQGGTPNGKAIFAAKCQFCHGVDGKLGLSGAADLSVSLLDQTQRIQVITKGRNLMTAFEGILSKEEIDAVATYVGSLKK